MAKKQHLITHEISHGNKISNNAEEIWGWSGAVGERRASRRALYFKELAQYNTIQYNTIQYNTSR